MQSKKALNRKEDRKERRTVESYYCSCNNMCSCTYNTKLCNPCDSVPSTAFLTRVETINDSRREGAYQTAFNGNFDLHS